MDLHQITIHDQRITYCSAGSGPVLPLIHGMAGSATTWRQGIPGLARRSTVVAPDLLVHGRSEKPPGDYSLGAFACTLRDLLVALGHERASSRAARVGLRPAPVPARITVAAHHVLRQTAEPDVCGR